MKRFLPYAIVALAVLVPAGVVVAAKSVKAKKAAETKVTHRTSKQKAANEKLVQELLAIIEETENKTTFAACIVCLTELKPQRDVVIPAIIRKADKMGWLKTDSPETEMIGECLAAFLPQKKNQQTILGSGYAYGPQPYPILPPPPSWPPQNVTYPVPPPPPPTPSAQQVPAWPPQMCAPPVPAAYQTCPITNPPCPTPCPAPAVYANPMPCCGSENRCVVSTFGIAQGTCANQLFVSVTPAQDKLTTELLKILDETESKVTFAVVVETLGERCDNWDAVIPAMIRKADRMGWLKVADKDFGDKFTENLMEAIAEKAKKPERTAVPAPTPCEAHGCPTPCPATCPNGTGLRFTVPLSQGETMCPGCCDEIQVLQSPSVERVPMPHRAKELAPSPQSKLEVLPMPQQPASIFSYWMSWITGD